MVQENMILTEHPYIVKVKGICGGRPIIKDTRTPVQTIVEYYRLGLNTAEILTELPYITEAQIHDVLSYFHEHKEDILDGIKADRQAPVSFPGSLKGVGETVGDLTEPFDDEWEERT